ncbi:hypothetical protein QUF64_04880 [Anaerolineales bacterium HSG6]|nr:hypothetical protein [Anaerolineales bacterium HSG6]MDM8529533.1 hypothetical protein [Anaerolineales bacterium HSG25]
MYWIIYCLFLVIGLILGGLFIKSNPHHQLRVNITLLFLSLFLTCMGVEFLFKVFFAQSDAFRYTLASRNWYDRYWEENSLGYRDVEWTADMLAGKTKVMVVGDSFAAGSGIEYPEDRFANQLGANLGNEYAIMVVASPGWDTIDEVQAIVEYPYTPDILVLSYYINDIEGVAYESGAQRPQIRTDPPLGLNWLVKNSYAMNFLYWRLVRFGPQEWASIYWNDWLLRIVNDPEIRWRHRQELLTIVEGAKAQQIPMVLVVFPNLAAIEASEPMVQPVIDLFVEYDVPVLDTRPILQQHDPADTMVNAIDSHPNEMINEEVAEALYQLLLEHAVIE